MDPFLRAGGGRGAGPGLPPGGLGALDSPSPAPYCCSFRPDAVALPGSVAPAAKVQAGKTWATAGELLQRLR